VPFEMFQVPSRVRRCTDCTSSSAHQGGRSAQGLCACDAFRDGRHTARVLLIADGNNLAWAGFHALRRAMGAESPDEKVRAALLGLTQSVVGFAVRAGEPPAGPGTRPQPGPLPRITRLVVAFDEGRPLRRRSIFPAYQTGREGDASFMENEPYILQAIDQFTDAAAMLPLEIVRGVNAEADDLISAVVLQSTLPARIASTDRDFLQLVDDRVSIYSPVKRLVVTTANFAAVTAPRGSDERPVPFPRERYLDYRAASGDASDNLPGIPAVGTLTAAKMLACAPLDAYLDDPSLAERALGRRNQRLEAALVGEARAIVDRNRSLMNLRLGAANFPDLGPLLRRGAWNEGNFRAWVAEQRIAALEIEAACAVMSGIAEAGCK
jgi:5'-3' exonuclease